MGFLMYRYLLEKYYDHTFIKKEYNFEKIKEEYFFSKGDKVINENIEKLIQRLQSTHPSILLWLKEEIAGNSNSNGHLKNLITTELKTRSYINSKVSVLLSLIAVIIAGIALFLQFDL